MTTQPGQLDSSDRFSVCVHESAHTGGMVELSRPSTPEATERAATDSARLFGAHLATVTS